MASSGTAGEFYEFENKLHSGGGFTTRGKRVEREEQDSLWIQEQLAMCCPDDPSGEDPLLNVNACGYFIDEYVKIFDRGSRRWIDFRMWPQQWDALELLMCNGRVAILKARQLGLTWLCLSAILWKLVYMPGTMAMLYSLREEEALELMKRLKLMYSKLPWWMREGIHFVKNTDDRWRMSNDNEVASFSTKSGDSYQANVILVDEATLVPDLHTLLGRIEPAVDSVPMGQLWMISRSNKDDPKNLFNSIYLDGKEQLKNGDRKFTDWVSMFLPWRAALWRDDAWYASEREKALRTKHHLDDLYSMYPNDDVEALAPSTANKRILRDWVMAGFVEMDPLGSLYALPADLRHVSDLRLYRLPERGKRYSIGVDTAEGLPTSNNSVVCVVDRDSGEEVATLCGKISPRDTAHDAAKLSLFYNESPVLVERNNHGYAVLLGLEEFEAFVLDGPDGMPGYRSGKQTKIQLYDNCAEIFRDMMMHRESMDDLGVACEERGLIHSTDMALELMSIERLTLEAPENHLDDMADAFAFAQMARVLDYAEGVKRADYSMF